MSERLSALDRRPPRDVRIEDHARSLSFWELMLQGTRGYAGDDENPRPLPQRTLYTIARGLDDATHAGLVKRLREQPDDSPPWAWDALMWVFCWERHRLPTGHAVPVPREHLWWLASRGDTVLLSDKLTHHYSSVDRMNEAERRIYFLDDWPDRCFLLEGQNTAGVAARLEPYMGGELAARHDGFAGKWDLSLSFEEFSRVAVGLMTQDTPLLAEQYLSRFPQMRERMGARYGMGALLMDTERDHLSPHAVQHFAAASRLARVAGQGGTEEDRLRCDSAYLHALHVARHFQRQCGDALAAKPFDDALQAHLRTGDEAAWLAALSPEQLMHVGNAAMHGGELGEALRFLDLALAKEPGHEGARHLRAMTYSRADRWAEALPDIEAALQANQIRINHRQEQLDARDPRDEAARTTDESLLGGLKSRRLQQRGFEVQCHVALEQWQQVLALGESLAADSGRPELMTDLRELMRMKTEGGTV